MPVDSTAARSSLQFSVKGCLECCKVYMYSAHVPQADVLVPLLQVLARTCG